MRRLVNLERWSSWYARDESAFTVASMGFLAESDTHSVIYAMRKSQKEKSLTGTYQMLQKVNTQKRMRGRAKGEEKHWIRQARKTIRRLEREKN